MEIGKGMLSSVPAFWCRDRDESSNSGSNCKNSHGIPEILWSTHGGFTKEQGINMITMTKQYRLPLVAMVAHDTTLFESKTF